MPDALPPDIARGYDYTQHSIDRPGVPPPGDKIDSDLDRLIGAVNALLEAVRNVAAAQTIAAADLGPDVLPHLRNALIPDITAQFAVITNATASALTSLADAQAAANRALASQARAAAFAADAQTARQEALTTLSAVHAAARDADTDAVDAENAANDAELSANRAANDQRLAGAWAEYLEGGNPIPPHVFAHTAITGDHWSARWWANRAAGAFGELSTLYLGALPAPPTETATGAPIPIGGIYYNTSSDTVFIWNGTEWQPFWVPTKAVTLSLYYQTTANQTVIDLTDPDITGGVYTIDAVNPEPIEVFVNGVRIPGDIGVAGDWALDPATSTITFNAPLNVGSIVQADILAPPSELAPSRVQTLALLDFDIDPATGNPGQIDGTRTTFPLTTNSSPHTPVTVSSAQELLVSMDGVIQQPGSDYNAVGTTITFGEAPQVGSRAWASWYGPGMSVDNLTPFLPLAGGTMTGPLTLAGDPTAPLQSATKQYADTFLPLAGGTVTGNLTTNGNVSFTLGAVSSGSPTSALPASVSVQALAGTVRAFRILTGSSLRWQISGTSTAEGGSNAGTDFAITRYSDAGAVIDTPVTINRATGALTLGNAPNAYTVQAAGGSSSVNGSAITIKGGDGSGSRSGGDLILSGGAPGTTGSAGGKITISTATASTSGGAAVAGDITIKAGDASTSSVAVAGNIIITAGKAITAGNTVGALTLRGGSTDTGTVKGGSAILQGGLGTNFNGSGGDAQVLAGTPNGTGIKGNVLIDGTTVQINGALNLTLPAAKTGTAYTVAAGDTCLILNPSGAFTLTLPAAASFSGRLLRLKLIAAFAVTSASSNVVPLAGGSASTAILTGTAGKFALLQSDGTNWQIMEAN